MFIRSSLESSDPGASNGGPNVEIRPLEANLASFEVARLPWNRFEIEKNGEKVSGFLATQTFQKQ